MSSCILLIFFHIPSDCYPDKAVCAQKTLAVFIGMAARFGITVFSSILISYTSEIYPSVVKNVGLGISVGAGKLGALTIPIVINSLHNAELGAFVVFSSLAVAAFLVEMRLPETFGESVGDFIEETEGGEKALISFHGGESDGKRVPLLD